MLKPVSLDGRGVCGRYGRRRLRGVCDPHLFGRLCASARSRMTWERRWAVARIWRGYAGFSCRTVYPEPGALVGGVVCASGCRHPGAEACLTLGLYCPNCHATTADLWVAGPPQERQRGQSAGVLHRSAGQGLRRPARSGCHCAPRRRNAFSTDRGSWSMELRLLQQGHDQREKIFGYLGIALVRRMNAVGLHAVGDSV